jgi:hypothetical protein
MKTVNKRQVSISRITASRYSSCYCHMLSLMVFRGSGMSGVLLHKLLDTRIGSGRTWPYASASDNVKDTWMERVLGKHVFLLCRVLVLLLLTCMNRDWSL